MREKGGVGDTTAGEMRRAGIQLNGAQWRDLALLPSLPFFTPQLPTGTGESILGDDLSRSKTRIKWPYIPGGTECLCFCPHHVDPFGHTARPSTRNGAQGRGLPFFLSFSIPFFLWLFAFCFLIFDLIFFIVTSRVVSGRAGSSYARNFYIPARYLSS